MSLIANIMGGVKEFRSPLSWFGYPSAREEKGDQSAIELAMNMRILAGRSAERKAQKEKMGIK